jgi:hypothetical protein
MFSERSLTQLYRKDQNIQRWILKLEPIQSGLCSAGPKMVNGKLRGISITV